MSKVLPLSFVAALAALSSLGAIRAITPDGYGNDPKAWQWPRYREQMQVATNGGAKVVFLGDSITHFWDSTGRDQKKKYFSEGDYKMLNLGISADRTEHVLWRLTEGKELDGYEAKVVCLMIGTNNTGHFPFEKEPPSDTILGIRAILKVIREKQPNAIIVLSPIFPRGANDTDGCRRRNETVNREIMRLTDGKTIFWCDFNDQFLCADGTLPREIFPDLLHPAPLGYEIWYTAVKPYVDYALSDGKLPAPANRYAPNMKRGRFRTDEVQATFPATRIRCEGYGNFDWWLDRLQEKRNQIAESKGEIDIVFAGDSITHFWEEQGKESLAELKKTYSILNLGYSGDCTDHLLWRLRNGELEGYRTKCVMLMIGTNNTWHRNEKPEDVAAGVKAILGTIAEKQPQAKVLLLPVFPIGDSPTHAKRTMNDKTNGIIRNFADGKKVIWVDFNAKFLDEKGDNVKWMPDHAHPNAEGYREIWLPAVLPHFKEIVGR